MALVALLLPSTTVLAQEDRPFFENKLPNNLHTPALVLPNLTTLFTGKNDSPKGTIVTLVNIVIRILGFIAGFLALAFVMYGGFKYIMSGGDPRAADQGKQMIAGAIVGILIFSLSLALVRYLVTNVASLSSANQQQKR